MTTLEKEPQKIATKSEVVQIPGFEKKVFEKLGGRNYGLTDLEVRYFKEHVLNAIRSDEDNLNPEEKQRVRYSQDKVLERMDEPSSVEYIKAKNTEMIFEELINKHNWLGGSVRLVPSSEYDDWVNGVDGVLEFNTSDGVVRLGVDFTGAGLGESMRKKRERMMTEIERGTLAKVSHFEDTSGESKKIEFLPRAIVGVDKGIIKRCLEKMESLNDAKTKNNRKASSIIEETIKNEVSKLTVLGEIEFNTKFSLQKVEKSRASEEVKKKMIDVFLQILKELEKVRQQVIPGAELELERQMKIKKVPPAMRETLFKNVLERDNTYNAIVNTLSIS